MPQFAPLVPLVCLQLLLVVAGTSTDESGRETCSAQAPRESVGAQLLQLTKFGTLRRAPTGTKHLLRYPMESTNLGTLRKVPTAADVGANVSLTVGEDDFRADDGGADDVRADDGGAVDVGAENDVRVDVGGADDVGADDGGADDVGADWQADAFDAVADKSFLICSQKVGKQSPLTPEGYKAVSDSCCFDDMKDFVRRAVEMEGLQVCDEGGLSGLTPFYSCSSESTSFEQLHAAIQQARGGMCPWLSNVGELCESPDPKCGVSMNPDERKPMVKGYIGVEADNNPPALVTNGAVKDRVRRLLAHDFAVVEGAVVVSVGTGPVGDSRYPVSLKSNKTGKFVEPHVDGQLVASSVELKSMFALYDPGTKLFSLEGIAVEHEHLVVSNGHALVLAWVNASTPGDGNFTFQSEDGRYVCEDAQGRVILSNSTRKARLHVEFQGFSSLSSGSSVSDRSFLALRQSCTVFVTYEVVQTDPPTLDEEQVNEAVNKLDPVQLQTEMSKEVAQIEPCIGALGISTFKYCRDNSTCNSKSLKNAHTDQAYRHVSDDADNVTMPKLHERDNSSNSL